jgi:hypothetical protein
MQTNPLNTAAAQIIADYQTPSNFMEFLCDAISRVNEYPQPKFDRNTNGITLLNDLMLNIGIPWSTTHQVPDNLDKLETALENIYTWFGSAGYFEELAIVSLAQTKSAINGGEMSEQYASKILKGMEGLYSIGRALNEHDFLIQKRAFKELNLVKSEAA